MRSLRLVALSDDGRNLILTVESPEPGEEPERFELPIDERVRAAARGDARLGQIEDLGNTLPPRVIQARIRAGETPEQVAQASGTRVERIMRFAHPVLQERSRVAEQAREARVRLSEGMPSEALEQFMVQRLRLLGGEIDAIRWDAFRGDDGAWVVTAAWRAGEKSGTARWGYDVPARVVAPLDAATTDFAECTRLVRVVPEVPGGSALPPREPSVAVLRESVRHGAAAEPNTGRAVAQPAEPADRAPETATSTVVDEAYLDAIAENDTVVLARRDDEPADPRAVVPAWEDIVFGVRRNR